MYAQLEEVDWMVMEKCLFLMEKIDLRNLTLKFVYVITWIHSFESTFGCIKAANMDILDEFLNERDCIKGFGEDLFHMK